MIAIFQVEFSGTLMIIAKKKNCVSWICELFTEKGILVCICTAIRIVFFHGAEMINLNGAYKAWMAGLHHI